MPAEELRALEIKCLKLPAEEVPDDDPRNNRIHPLNTNVPEIHQLQAILQDIGDITAEESLRQHSFEVRNYEITAIKGFDRLSNDQIQELKQQL